LNRKMRLASALSNHQVDDEDSLAYSETSRRRLESDGDSLAYSESTRRRLESDGDSLAYSESTRRHKDVDSLAYSESTRQRNETGTLKHQAKEELGELNRKMILAMSLNEGNDDADSLAYSEAESKYSKKSSMSKQGFGKINRETAPASPLDDSGVVNDGDSLAYSESTKHLNDEEQMREASKAWNEIDELTRKMHLASSLEHISRPAEYSKPPLRQPPSNEIPDRLKRKIELRKQQALSTERTTKEGGGLNQGKLQIASSAIEKDDSYNISPPRPSYSAANGTSTGDSPRRSPSGSLDLGSWTSDTESPTIMKAKEIVMRRRGSRTDLSDQSVSLSKKDEGDDSSMQSEDARKMESPPRKTANVNSQEVYEDRQSAENENEVSKNDDDDSIVNVKSQDSDMLPASNSADYLKSAGESLRLARQGQRSLGTGDDGVESEASSAYAPLRITRRSIHDRVSVFEKDKRENSRDRDARVRNVSRSFHGAEIIKYGQR